MMKAISEKKKKCIGEENKCHQILENGDENSWLLSEKKDTVTKHKMKLQRPLLPFLCKTLELAVFTQLSARQATQLRLPFLSQRNFTLLEQPPYPPSSSFWTSQQCLTQ